MAAPVIVTVTTTLAPGAAQPAPPRSVTVTPTPAPAPSSPPPVDPRQAAIDTLERLVAQDAASRPVRGQWVAQLASKYEGIHDDLVRPEPYTVPEILAEHQALRGNPVFGSSVRLLHQGDWGRIGPHDPPMWVTVVDLNAPSAAVVRSWCEAHFSERGKALENVCMPRQLTRKGS